MNELQTSICERCGSFAQLAAWHGRSLCAACGQRRHPAELEPFNFVGLVRASFWAAGGVGFRAFGALAVIMALQHAFDLLLGASSPRANAAFTVLSMPVLTILTGSVEAVIVLAAITMIARVEPPAYREASRRALQRWPKLVGTTLAQMLVGVMASTVVGLLLVPWRNGIDRTVLALPGQYVSVIVAIAVPIALLEDGGVWRALGRSAKRLIRLSGTVFAVELLFFAPVWLRNDAAARLGSLLADAPPAFWQGLGPAWEAFSIALSAARLQLGCALTAVLYLRVSQHRRVA